MGYALVRMSDTDNDIFNLRIRSERVLATPKELLEKLPRSEKATSTVQHGRSTICRILDRKDPRLFVVVGPCSIHDLKAAEEYALKLSSLSKALSKTLFLVMRVYFEKPRTTVGWKGLINDPYLDGSCSIDAGLQLARKLLLRITEMGLATATEALDPILPQYLNDLICWTAIGARTTESQKHRELASGLSTPVGFKNGTDGNIQIAMNALKSVREPHHFLGINLDGATTVMETTGNEYGHIVLRGGLQPNYDRQSIAFCEAELEKADLRNDIIVDCSHGNSSKRPELQPQVMMDCAEQIREGNTSIVGLMLESNLFSGRQDIPEDISQLRYGISVTDACIDWESTERALENLANILETSNCLSARRKK